MVRQQIASTKMMLKKKLRLVNLVFIALSIFNMAAVEAAELKILGAIAMQEITADLVPKFERATGHKVVVIADTLGGIIKRIEDGETADLVMLPAPGIANLVRQGKASESEVRSIARSSVGMAIRKGSNKPDISTPESFRNAMLSSKSVFISDPSQGGFVTPHLLNVFARLGISEEMKGKLVFTKKAGTAGIQETITSANVDIGLNQLQEFAPISSMEIVGPLPGDLGLTTTFAGVVLNGSKELKVAQAWVSFLRTPEAASVIKSKGMELAWSESCNASPVTLQILGSGGPVVSKDRASSSYLLWIDGRSRMLVDMGGGAFLRFGQAEAKLTDLSLAAMSHFHPDHVADLPALFWLSNRVRKEPLPFIGPSGNAKVPGVNEFLSRLFDVDRGAFQVMGTSMGAPQVGDEGGGVKLEVSAVDITKNEPMTVFEKDGMKVTALTIPHGNIPALAYRVETRGVSIVFSSDQTGTNPKFVEFVRGTNVLIMHMAIAAGTTNPLHAAPAVIGRIAQQANVGRLIVSHIGPFDVNAAILELRTTYSGPLTVGADLQCTPVVN
jgi:ribonuclease BN (tRNA processing enzyme)/ABC-type molybdate transport system substrate-binding protein